MPRAPRRDPFAAFNFSLEIDGLTAAAFSECSGLASETEVIEYREGSEATLGVRKLPGLTKYPPIVLKRGFTTDKELWNWRKTVTEGRVERKNGSVILLDSERNKVARWNFREGWPAKWEGPHLKAKGNEVAIETLEIVHEGLELDE